MSKNNNKIYLLQTIYYLGWLLVVLKMYKFDIYIYVYITN